MSTSFDPLWGNPLEHTYSVKYGGIGPIPGTEEAIQQGCVCPGEVGDLDKRGHPGGYTVDKGCPLHGQKAQKQLQIEARNCLRPKAEIPLTDKLQTLQAKKIQAHEDCVVMAILANVGK